MGSEVGGEVSEMLGLRMAQRHKRSKSFQDKKRAEDDNNSNCSLEASQQRNKPEMGHLEEFSETKHRQSSPNTNVQNSLKQEILQLEKILQDQFEVRCALEKALGYQTSYLYSPNETKEISMPKPAMQLIKEVAVLELEVVRLEQYLLSLYREAFDQHISSASPKSKNDRQKSPITTPRRCQDKNEADTAIETDPSLVQPINPSAHDNQSKAIDFADEEWNQTDAGVQRCRSELSQDSAFECRTSPEDSWGKAVCSCDFQPLSVAERADAQNGETLISLAEHLGTQISDHILETPNKLSEEMIKCMATVYCKLAEPSSAIHGLSSPNSSLSSTSAFSPCDQYEMWSPGSRNNSSFDVQLENPFHVEGLKEFSGPYSTMVEVLCIYKDAKKASEVEDLLQNFMSLISRLEEIDPRKLNHEEKLAFWINVHNALVMHAFLAYGIPQNNAKRVLLLLKAAYNVGGHTVSADAIQGSILGCRMPRPGQWLRLLFVSRKFKAGDERQAFAIDHPEPFLHFALCSGNHSDPAVRVYTPKGIRQQLETAKEEYIRATISISNQKIVLLPKLVETFGKDSGLSSSGVIEMVQESLPESSRKSFKKPQHQQGKSSKRVEWIPHSFTFRYLISKEILK